MKSRREDRFGLPLSTASDEAAAAYRDGVDRVLSAWNGADAAFDRTIAADPEFALAHIGRARVHQILGEGAQARAATARARELAQNASARERGHVDAIASAIEGQPARATALTEAHLEDHPRDAMVLSLLLGAFGLYAFSGRPDHDAARVAICERHAAQYGEDWWFTTYRGWSLTECGDLKRGRVYTERGLALRRANANAAHALSHVLFEQGDVEAAVAFLNDWRPAYDRASFLEGHLAWHHALIALEKDDTEGALVIYEARLRPDVSDAPPMNRLTDAASLLWRLALGGATIAAERWREVVAYGENTFPRAGAHFADLHCGLAAAASADTEAFDARVSALETLHACGKLGPGHAAVELCRGLRAFADGDYRRAVQLLEPLQTDVVRIGGSHAQRQLCEDTLIVACLRAGEGHKARALIDRRLHHRPSARDARWRAMAS